MNPAKPEAEVKPVPEPSPAPSNFVRDIIVEDLKTKKFGDAAIQTRFPPEPNGYLHIGHAEAICLDFGLADEFGGKTNLRFDDTNPVKEEQEYVDSIMEVSTGSGLSGRGFTTPRTTSTSCTLGTGRAPSPLRTETRHAASLRLLF